jgi:predicted secreted protein
MKLPHSRIFTLFPVAFLAILGCPKTIHNSGRQMINLTENDIGKKLTITKGEEFTLTLPNHVDGGYRFDKEQYDSSVLKLEKHLEQPPPAGSRPGASGTGIWQFIAQKNGKTSLKITSSRPWKKTEMITSFENMVIVK